MTDRGAWGVALLRIMLGIIFVMHGYYVWAVLGLQPTAELITHMGNPAELAGLLAWYVVVAHVAGGLLILVGLWTTAAALAQVPILAAAVFLLHWPQGFFMRGIIVDAAAGRAIAGGYEHALLVLVATLALALTGPGAFAFDTTLLARPLRRMLP